MHGRRQRGRLLTAVPRIVEEAWHDNPATTWQRAKRLLAAGNEQLVDLAHGHADDAEVEVDVHGQDCLDLDPELLGVPIRVVRVLVKPIRSSRFWVWTAEKAEHRDRCIALELCCLPKGFAIDDDALFIGDDGPHDAIGADTRPDLFDLLLRVLMGVSGIRLEAVRIHELKQQVIRNRLRAGRYGKWWRG